MRRRLALALIMLIAAGGYLTGLVQEDRIGFVIPMGSPGHKSETFHKLATGWTVSLGVGENRTALRYPAEAFQVYLAENTQPGSPQRALATGDIFEVQADARVAATRIWGSELQPVEISRMWFERGKSSGLATGLYMLELAGGPYTAEGVRVGATGVVGDDGYVRKVGRVGVKTRAAIAADIDILLVPVGNLDEAEEAARGSNIEIVPISTLRRAVWKLCARNPNQDEAPVCQRLQPGRTQHHGSQRHTRDLRGDNSSPS